MEDAAHLFEMRKNPDLMRFIDRPLHRTLDESIEMLQKIEDGIKNNNMIAWGIVLKNNPEMIGNISYHRIEKENHRAEIGYILHPDYWRQGIVHEAMKAVLDYGFSTMNLHSIEANINPDNVASSNLLKKNGFVKEAFFRENYYFDRKFIDTEIYSLLIKNHQR